MALVLPPALGSVYGHQLMAVVQVAHLEDQAEVVGMMVFSVPFSSLME